MRIRLAIPDGHLSPEALNAALEATTLTNESLLKAGLVPLAKEAIARGVRWRAEPPGDEHFDLATTVLGRGWGDCDDLAPYEAASLRVTGVDPGARAVVRRSGPKRWHAVVLTSDGEVRDPSRWAGMGKRGAGVNGVGAVAAPRYAPIVSPLQPGLVAPRVALNLVPWRGGYAGRVDVPLGLAALASNGFAADPRMAMLRALEGASVVGESAGAHPECVLRVNGLHEFLDPGGGDPREIAEALNYISPQVAGDVVGLLPALTAAIPMAGGLLSAAGNLFGGGGGGKAPAPAPAPAAAPAGGGGGRGGMWYNPAPYNPGAPIIVRF